MTLQTSRNMNKHDTNTVNFGNPRLTSMEVSRSNPTTAIDSLSMFLCRFVYHPKPLGSIMSEL